MPHEFGDAPEPSRYAVEEMVRYRFERFNEDNK